MKEQARYQYPSQIVIDLLRLIGYSISKLFWFLRYQGVENIPPNDSPPFLIIANHQTYIDPVWIVLPMRRRIRYMAFEPAFGWPVIGDLIRYLGAFPVSQSGSGMIASVKHAIAALRDGAVLVVFPEGAREFADGKLLDFKPGAVRIALRAGVAVLPVTISGGNRIWPQKQRYPRLFRRVTVKYHPMMTLGREERGRAEEQADELMAALKELIRPVSHELSSADRV